jgi:hypothetical protein
MYGPDTPGYPTHFPPHTPLQILDGLRFKLAFLYRGDITEIDIDCDEALKTNGWKYELPQMVLRNGRTLLTRARGESMRHGGLADGALEQQEARD